MPGAVSTTSAPSIFASARTHVPEASRSSKQVGGRPSRVFSPSASASVRRNAFPSILCDLSVGVRQGRTNLP